MADEALGNRVCDASRVTDSACSDDRVEVYHGLPDPAFGCGKHVQSDMHAVADGHRDRMQNENRRLIVLAFGDDVHVFSEAQKEMADGTQIVAVGANLDVTRGLITQVRWDEIRDQFDSIIDHR